MKEYTPMTVGMDLGDKVCELCLLDDAGDVIERKRISATKQSLTKFFSRPERMRVAIESGFHSPWVSHLLEGLGHDVIVANSRRVALISQNNKKSDVVDAELLARLARTDVTLLSPIEHRSKQQQEHMAVVRARDALVRARTMLINHCRGSAKSVGGRLPSTATSRFHKLQDKIPDELQAALNPLIEAIQETNEKIKKLDQEIERIARESYPVTAQLQEVPGVGPVTALVFVLTVSNPSRFKHTRNVGAYLGMVPRKHQSGDLDPSMNISRAGSTYMRRLLVNAAHYVLGPFGPDTALRRFGMSIAARGGKLAKKRAVVAVARKLAVLLLSLWKSGEDYTPLGRLNEKKQEADSSGTSGVTRWKVSRQTARVQARAANY